MSTTVTINSDGWSITTFYGGALGRAYEIYVPLPGKGRRICTEEEFLAFFDSIPDRDV